MVQNVAQVVPKWTPKPIRAPRSILDAQNGAKMPPKWSQWRRNGPKMEPSGRQNRSKIASKINAKINTPKTSKNDAKVDQNDAKMVAKFIQNLIFFATHRFFKKPRFSPGKPYFLTCQGYQKSIKNRSRNDAENSSKKLMQKLPKVVPK